MNTTKTYFETLPRYALPALQAAWDKVSSRSFGSLAIFKGFCRDMEEVGCVPPSQAVMNQWIGEVSDGLIERPGASSRQTDASPPKAEKPEPLEPIAPSTVLFFSEDFPAEADPEDVMRDNATALLRSVRDQLVSDLVEELTRTTRLTVNRLVLSALRGVVAEMEDNLSPVSTRLQKASGGE